MEEKCVIICPWHNFEFDLDTGRSSCEPDRLRIATYRAELEEDEVVVYAQPPATEPNSYNKVQTIPRTAPTGTSR